MTTDMTDTPPVTYDPEAHAIYARLSSKPVASNYESDAMVLVDLDEDGEIVGVEVLLGGEK